MACGSKINNTCVETTYAPCTIYQGEIPTYSPLVDSTCVNIEETTEDTYSFITDIREQTDLSELGANCLTYIPDPEGRTVVKNVLLKYEEEICLLKQEVENLKTQAICDKDITSCVDTSSLVDPCGDPITTLGQLLTYLTTA